MKINTRRAIKFLHHHDFKLNFYVRYELICCMIETKKKEKMKN